MHSYVITFHSSRLDNLNQMLSHLVSSLLWADLEVLLICQDEVNLKDIVKVPCHQRLINLKLDQFNKGLLCNVGVREAKYDDIALLDGDRLLSSSFFQHAFILLQNNHFVSSRFLIQLDKVYTNEEIRRSEFECEPQFKSITNELHHENLFSGCVVFNRKDYLELDGMDESYIGRSPADADMTMKIMQSGKKFIFTNDIEVHLYHDRIVGNTEIVLNAFKYNEKWKLEPSRRFLHSCKTFGINIDDDFKDMSCGIITASSSNYFDGLKLLCESIKLNNNYPIVCVDFGLLNKQKDWCIENDIKLVHFSWFNLPPVFDKWEKYLIWVKPFLIGFFRYALWLDADVISLGNLDEAFDLIKNAPLLIKHDDQFYERAVNNYKLYQNMSIPPHNHLRVNAGVCGFDIIRDYNLLQNWRKFVSECQDENIRDLVHYQDQGALNFILNRDYLTHKINTNNESLNKFYNFRTYHQIGGMVANCYYKGELKKAVSFLKSLYPNTTLLHWAGPNKIWHFNKTHYKLV